MGRGRPDDAGQFGGVAWLTAAWCRPREVVPDGAVGVPALSRHLRCGVTVVRLRTGSVRKVAEAAFICANVLYRIWPRCGGVVPVRQSVWPRRRASLPPWKRLCGGWYSGAAHRRTGRGLGDGGGGGDESVGVLGVGAGRCGGLQDRRMAAGGVGAAGVRGRGCRGGAAGGAAFQCRVPGSCGRCALCAGRVA